MRIRLLLPCLGLAVLGFVLGKNLPVPAPSRAGEPHARPVPTGVAREAGAAVPPGESGAESPKPRPAETLDDVWKNAKSGAASPADFRLRVMSAINRLSADQLVSVLQTELDAKSFLHTERFDFGYAAKRLSELAPEKAADLWAANDATRASGFGSLLLPWAKKDPEALTQWVLTQTAEIQQAARGALALSASTDPDRFCRFAHLLTDVPKAGTAAASAMHKFLEKNDPAKDPSKALEFAGKLPEGILRNRALAELAQSPGVDVRAHPEIVQALAALPDTETHQAGVSLAKKADSLPPGPVRESAQRATFQKLAQSNAAEAAKKLEGLSPASPDYPAAVRGFVEGAVRKDPAAAAAWAVSIPASAAQHRIGALDRVAAAYFKSNPNEARTWVEKAPLSDEEYRRLTGSPRPR